MSSEALGKDLIQSGIVSWRRATSSWIQVAVVTTSTHSLVTDSKSETMSSVEVGSRLIYHFRSWCIHANTLADLTKDVIRKTTELYISERAVRAELYKSHADSIYQNVTMEIEELRNAFVAP